MTNCTNCFSGCVETTSDKCVKYTGASIEFLGITTGDTLESVIEHVTIYLATVFTGTGIYPTIDQNYICDIIKQFLPCQECGDYTLVDILTAIIRTLCLLETEIEAQSARIDVIEANYTPDCISVAANAGTHATLQAVINQLCSSIGDIVALQNLYATCVTTGSQNNINTLIQNYLNSISTSTKMNARMVPYVVYPFYPPNGDLSAFSANGVGSGVWENVYLCNGWNGLTPDLRGRIIVGTVDMGGTTTDPDVAPGPPDNPVYTLGMKYGANGVSLAANNIPSHTHSLTSAGHHTHTYTELKITGSTPPGLMNDSDHPVASVISDTDEFPDHTHTVGYTVGGTNTHLNVPPVRALFYIMYIP